MTATRHHILANSGVEIDLEKCSELNEGLPLHSHYFNEDDDEAFVQTPVDDDLPEQSLFPSRRARRRTEKGVNMKNARKRALSFAHSESEVVSQKRQKGILKSTERKILKKAKNIKLRRNKRGSAKNAVEEQRRELREAIRSPTPLKSPASIKSPASLEDSTQQRSRARGRHSKSDQETVQNPTNNKLDNVIPCGASETELTARSIPTRKQVETRSRSLSVSSGIVKHRRKRKGHLEQWDRQLFGRKRRTQSLGSGVERKSGRVVKNEAPSKDSHELRTRNKLRSTSNGLVRTSISDLKQLDEHDLIPGKIPAEGLTNGIKNVKVMNKRKLSESDNEYIPQFYDVVWAKCKGFKPYPALVRLLHKFDVF